MKSKILWMLALTISLASCKKDECPEVEKPKKEKCSGCKPVRRPLIDVKK